MSRRENEDKSKLIYDYEVAQKNINQDLIEVKGELETL